VNDEMRKYLISKGWRLVSDVTTSAWNWRDPKYSVYYRFVDAVEEQRRRDKSPRKRKSVNH
jgi:hypothetical protein